MHKEDAFRRSATVNEKEKDIFSRCATVFIDNLPQGTWKVWLYNLLIKFGKIQSINIPNKKSRTTGNKFCFVRFVSPRDAQRAVEEVHGKWIWGDYLVANIARFGIKNKRGLNQQRNGRTGDERSMPSKEFIPQHKNREKVWRKKEIRLPQKENNQSSSYWIKKIPPIKVKERGNGWLYRSAIAKLSSTRLVVRIQDQLKNLGHSHVLVRNMGGDMAVITFKDPVERDSMFNGGKMAWLTEWFVESFKWENTKTNPCSRLVWLNCYGVPLHLWNHETFSKLGRTWGEVIMVADETIKNLSFAVGKVLISTTTMDSINKVVELDNNGNLTQVRVMEEQTGNTTLRTECAYPGCQVEAPSLHKSMDESRLNNSLENSSMQLFIQKEIGEEARSKKPPIEEMAESTSSTVAAVPSLLPSLLGPRPTMVGKPIYPVSVDSMQIVPYKGPGHLEQTIRGSRTSEHSTKKVKSPATPYLDALKRNLVLPKPPITPLKVNSLLPLISTYISHNPPNSLTIAPKKQQITPNSLNGLDQISILSTKSKKNKTLVDKPKRKQRAIVDILGLPKLARSKKRGRRGKQRCVVFRSAMAAAALSVSTEGIVNRNRIMLSESKAACSITKILETDYMGNDEEVMSRIMVTDEEEELRAVLQAHPH